MKFAVCLFATLACTFAQPTEEIDFSHIIPRHLWVNIPGEPPAADKPSSKIINGHDALPGTLTYQAGLLIDGRGFCGGSLIKNNFILTAAHCVDDAHQAQVVLGHHDIQEGLSSQSVISSTILYIHPQWNPAVLQNDVALIRIPEVSGFEILPLAHRSSSDFAGQVATLSGWGRESDDSNSIASYLQVVQLEVMTNLRCRLNFLGQIIEDQHICTFGSNGNQNVGACNGDSGGPLVVDGQQVGIVSFGNARCESGFPSVFARVSVFEEFITGIINS